MKYCLVLICLILPVHSNICCSPVQYETKEGLLTGSVNDMGDAAATYGTIGLSVDGVNKRVFENMSLTVNNDTRHYQVLQLYNQNVEYVTEGNVCTTGTPRTAFRRSCIPDNATALPWYFLGPNKDLAVQPYLFKMDRNNIEVAVTGSCIPVLYRAHGEIEGQNVTTFTGFLGLSEGIKDPSVFDIPSICNHTQPVTASHAPLRRRRSVYSQLAHL